MNKIEFDEANHIYTVNGHIYPSTSQILQDCGLSNFNGIPQSILDKAAHRGTYIHKLLELYDNENLGEYDKEYEGYLEQWYKVRKLFNITKFKVIETPLASTVNGFATTPDRATNKYIIDIKSGTPYKEHALQTAAHNIVIKENYGIDKDLQRFCCYIKKDSFELIEYANPKDEDIFLAAVEIWYFKNETKI